MKKKHIIVFGFPAWEGDYTKSTVELVKELSFENKVIYIDYGYTLLDFIRRLGKNFPAKKRILQGKSISPYPNRTLKVYNLPILIPYNWCKNQWLLDFILKINFFFIKKRIYKIRFKEDCTDAIWINAFNPFFAERTMNEFSSEDHWYYGYDDISQAPWINSHAQKYEFDYIKVCKGAFASSKHLLAKYTQHNPNTHLIENGVDLSVFTKTEFVAHARKTIGYIGSIDNRLDWELLISLFKDNPDLDFLFIGRIMNPDYLEVLNTFNNVKHMPAMDPSSLVKHASVFDLGLIPFLRNEFTKSIYPLKANEYLALGIPVVSTDFTDLSSFENYICVANNQCDFQTHVLEELATDTNLKRDQRSIFAQHNSWTRRALELKKHLFHNILDHSSSIHTKNLK